MRSGTDLWGGGADNQFEDEFVKPFPETDKRIEPSSAAFTKNLQKESLAEACSGIARGEVGIS